MCSIVGYVGVNKSRDFILNGLKNLEYRGYDSAGFACFRKSIGHISYSKSVGRLENLINKLDCNPIDGHIGIGHTRWSTHGEPTEKNAHPQFNCQKTVAVVHNGIISNHQKLRNSLKKTGHSFLSETDSEVIAHITGLEIASHSTLKEAVVGVIEKLEGTYAFLALLRDYSNSLVLVRKRSPLCVGVGDGYMFAASDPLAFADKTKKVLFMPYESFAILKKDEIKLYDFDGNALPIVFSNSEINLVPYDYGEFQHYMLKEIYEQKEAINKSVKTYKGLGSRVWDYIGLTEKQVKKLEYIQIIGAGSSWHASRIAQFFFEMITQIPTGVSLSSEFRYMPFFPRENALYLFVSQSGETADTLEALRRVRSLNLKTITLTNVASSTMVREADGFLLTQAGPKVEVVSTKAFTTQMTVLYWLANKMAFARGTISKDKMGAIEEDILVAAQVLECSIENYKRFILETYAKQYSKFRKFIFLGRHVTYPFALEAALKLKEVSYIFAQCYPAGELKHGPMASIDKESPVFIFSHGDELIYREIVSDAREVRARGGIIVAFVFEGQSELMDLADTYFIIPSVAPLLVPIAMSGLMQFLVYCIAKELGCPMDRPRNLAEFATIEKKNTAA